MIDTRDSNTNLNLTSLSLSNMQISGPPAFDGSTFARSRLSSARAEMRLMSTSASWPWIWSGPTTRHGLDCKTRRFRAGRSSSTAGRGPSRETRCWVDGPDLLAGRLFAALAARRDDRRAIRSRNPTSRARVSTGATWRSPDTTTSSRATRSAGGIGQIGDELRILRPPISFTASTIRR